MYKSPIEAIIKDWELVVEKEVYKAVRKVGIIVDAEELRKALVFDRGQYGKGHADGEWDMFELISTAYYGKQYYFLQDNEMVYSRASGKYMTFWEAVDEFIKEVSGDDN